MTAEGPLGAGAGRGAADAGQLPGVAQEQQASAAPGGVPHLMQSLEVLRAELQGLIHDHHVVHGQKRQGFLQRSMEKKCAVTGIHIDSRMALRSSKADVCNGGLAAAGRSRADQDAVRLGGLLC